MSKRRGIAGPIALLKTRMTSLYGTEQVRGDSTRDQATITLQNMESILLSRAVNNNRLQVL